MKKRIALLAIIGITLLVGINQKTLSHAGPYIPPANYMIIDNPCSNIMDIIITRAPATITIRNMSDQTVQSFTALIPNLYIVALNEPAGNYHAIYRSDDIIEIDYFTKY